MREIKFRYWNGNRMMPQESFINHLNKYVARNDDKLMQCTGLKDKNGKEIYEGDIVGITNTYTIEDEKQKIFFKWGCYCIYDEDGFEQPLYSCTNENGTDHEGSHFVQVLGNIYENPELIKGDR
jgi:uncharacterized phage protein (TIGR01671 family)